MKINLDISFGRNAEEKEEQQEEKKGETMGRIKECIAKFGLSSFIAAELNHINPPKRNLGFVANCFTAVVLTDLIVEYGLKHKKFGAAKEPEVVAEAEANDCTVESNEGDDLK